MIPLILTAQMDPQVVTLLTRGGTGALILALAFAVWHQTRRADGTQAALTAAHELHRKELGDLHKEYVLKIEGLRKDWDDRMERVNEARIEEMTMVTKAVETLTDALKPSHPRGR